MNNDQSTANSTFMRKTAERLLGGLNMSWPVVLLFALATAVITTVFLVVPIFKDTSFQRMGETYEAWILFAVIIMANCKKPLESARKVFVFFLVSQPLIYLFQVPFSYMGWEIFKYYRFWFILTLLTFPGAFIGWYINKKNYLSAVIFIPVIWDLLLTGYGGIIDMMSNFPHMLVTTVFCLFQIILYCYMFLPGVWKKALALAIPLIVLIVMAVVYPQVDVTASMVLPDEPVLSEEAVVSVDDPEIATVQIDDPGSGSVYIKAVKYGTTAMTIKDGDRELKYTLTVYKDGTVNRIDIKNHKKEDLEHEKNS